MDQQHIDALRAHVQQHIEQTERYVRERQESMEVKKQARLTEIIREVLLAELGSVDEGLVGMIRNTILHQQKGQGE